MRAHRSTRPPIFRGIWMLVILLIVAGCTTGNAPAAQKQTAQSEQGSYSPLGAGAPRENAPEREAVEVAAGSGGNAQTGTSGSADATYQGSTQIPVFTAEMQASLNARENALENEKDPLTPVDLNAPVKNGPPDVPPTIPNKAPVLNDLQPNAITPNSLDPHAFVYYVQKDLGSGSGSIIPEPSHASNGNVVLETWNWYAGISKNGGITWTYYNPANLFPSSYGGFCCDQVAYYDQTHDMTIWILQYSPDVSGNNAIRLAWAQGKNGLSNASFCYTDFTPQQLGLAIGTNYDQPKFARSDNDYYLEMTQYGAAAGSIVIRFASSALTYPSCGGIGYQWYAPGLFSPGFTQRAYGTMYFAAHVSTSTLRVFAWPESAANWTGITTHDVVHTTYPQNYPYSCPRTGGSATSDWCQRRSFGGGWAHSDRIFTGWVTAGIITFAFDASQGTAGFGTFNYPYVHFVRVNESDFSHNSDYPMWYSGVAYTYFSAALNDNLRVAGTVIYGGGSYYEDCANIIWDDYSPGWAGPTSFATTDIHGAAYSNSDPNDTLSGDYTSTRRNGFSGITWSSSCYALVGGSTNANVHTYYLWFGRASDMHFVYTPVLIK